MDIWLEHNRKLPPEERKRFLKHNPGSYSRKKKELDYEAMIAVEDASKHDYRAQARQQGSIKLGEL